MMKEKLAAALCAALLVGSLSFAAAPATVQDAQKAVYTKSNGSTLTIQYPAVSVAGNAAASQKIAQYFIEEQAKAKAFFDKESMEGMKMTEEKSYVVTLNDGKYLSFIDQGSTTASICPSSTRAISILTRPLIRRAGSTA